MKLTITNQKGVWVVDSREVAEKTDKRHADLMRDIENYKVILENADLRSQEFFIPSTYKTEGNNKTYPCYLLTRKGCDMVANKMTGEKGVLFTAAYINRFYELERVALEKQTAEWVQARQCGKLTRQAETDVIKQLVSYAKEQGSSNSDKLYIVYSRLANKMAGVQGREIATAAQLSHLELMEHVILHCIREGMKLSEHYKQIYKRCKFRLEQLKNIAYLEQTA